LSPYSLYELHISMFLSRVPDWHFFCWSHWRPKNDWA